MGGGHNAHIHLHRLVVAHPLQLAALHKAQQLGLQRQRHLADLVQKQRAAVGGFDAPRAPLHRAGKGAARMAKEFGFKQRFRNRRAIDGNKRLAASAATAGAGPRPPVPCPSRWALRSAPASMRGATRRTRRLTSSMQGALPISSGSRSPARIVAAAGLLRGRTGSAAERRWRSATQIGAASAFESDAAGAGDGLGAMAGPWSGQTARRRRRACSAPAPCSRPPYRYPGSGAGHRAAPAGRDRAGSPRPSASGGHQIHWGKSCESP